MDIKVITKNKHTSLIIILLHFASIQEQTPSLVELGIRADAPYSPGDVSHL